MRKMKLTVFIFFFSFCHCYGEEGYFWHVTDLHWDFSYFTKGLSCTEKNTTDRGLYGNYLCDPPLILLDEALKGARKIKPDVDFIIWTGDTVPHNPRNSLSTDIVIKQLTYITDQIQGSFPDVPVYPALGNHDYYPQDQYPPGNDIIYNTTYSLWKSWIGDDSQEENFLKGGYYTTKTRQGHRIIALNTNLYFVNDVKTKGIDDPADQFAWLQTQLRRATRRKEKVLIIGHVSPGCSAPGAVWQMGPLFNDKLVNILQRYSRVITAVHLGHEHHDNFRIVYNYRGYPAVPLFVAPSMTPITWRKGGYHNPGIRLVKYDRQSNRQLDILQYYIDLSAANKNKHATVILGYAATEEYGVRDIMPQALDKLVNKFEDPSGNSFKRYLQWFNTNATRDFLCDAKCHKVFMCGLRHCETQAFSQCLSSTAEMSKFYYKKDLLTFKTVT